MTKALSPVEQGLENAYTTLAHAIQHGPPSQALALLDELGAVMAQAITIYRGQRDSAVKELMDLEDALERPVSSKHPTVMEARFLIEASAEEGAHESYLEGREEGQSEVRGSIAERLCYLLEVDSVTMQDRMLGLVEALEGDRYFDPTDVEYLGELTERLSGQWQAVAYAD